MFQLKAEDRLRSWRDFRHTLDSLPLDEALDQTAKLWANSPFVPYYLDTDQINLWPDPWTLVDENIYCDIARCLGIVYTMLLSSHGANLDVEIRVYKDPKKHHEFNLACFDQGKYILNMIDGEVVNIKTVEETLQLSKVISAVELQLENY